MTPAADDGSISQFPPDCFAGFTPNRLSRIATQVSDVLHRRRSKTRMSVDVEPLLVAQGLDWRFSLRNHPEHSLVRILTGQRGKRTKRSCPTRYRAIQHML